MKKYSPVRGSKALSPRMKTKTDTKVNPILVPKGDISINSPRKEMSKTDSQTDIFLFQTKGTSHRDPRMRLLSGVTPAAGRLTPKNRFTSPSPDVVFDCRDPIEASL